MLKANCDANLKQDGI